MHRWGTIAAASALLASAVAAAEPQLGPRTRLAGEELEMSVDIWGIGLVVVDWDADGVLDVIYAHAYPGCYDIFVYCGRTP